jgi:hypothetical protein
LFSFSSFVASKEADIIIYSLVEKKIQDRITTNEIGIRYFALSPDEKYLATINLKGAVAVYSLSYQKDVTNSAQVTISKDKLETHHVNLVSTKVINEDNVIGLRICWLSETILAIPSNKGSLVLLSKASDGWKESFLTSDNDLLSHGSNELNLVQKIADNYLLSSDLTGKILLWKLNSKNNMELSQPIRDWETSMTLFDFSYEAEKNLLFFTSNNNYGMIEAVLKESELPALVKKASPEKSKTEVIANKVAPVEVEEPITKAAIAMDENENDDDADFLAFDLDAFTQNPQQKTVVQPEATKPMEEEEEEDPLGDSFPVENTQMEITSPVKKLSKLTKAVEDKMKSPEKTVISTPVETIVKKKNPPLGSLLAAPPAASKDESPANKKPAVTKESIRALFKEEADEADDFDDEDDEGEDLNDRKTKKQDDDDLLLDEEDDLDNDFLVNDDDAEAAGVKLSGSDSSVLMKEIIKLKKQLKTKSFLMDSVESHPIVHPSSTPADEKSRRYLVWNHLGNISSREEALENRVEIRFTDISYHKNEVIADRTGFTMAALSGDGAAFASDIQDDDSEKSDLKKSKLLMEDIHEENLDMNAKGSVIYYHAFQTQNNKNSNNPEAMGNQLEGVNQTFRIQLLQKEKVETIALGKGFLAVTTSKNYLRIYNTVGMEMAVVYLKGKIVSLNAYDNVLGVIYHTSNTSVLPINGVFSLSIDVFEINWKNYFKMNSLVTGFPLPFFQPKQKLEWFGFDIDQKIVLIMDNLGNINALMKVMDYSWVPVMHIPSIRKSIDHKYWPITGKNNRLAYILLNGEKKPMVYPQPVTSVKAFKVPLSSMTHLPLSLPQNNKENSKDNNKESGKEKLTNYFYESMKVHHYENLLNEKTHDYLLNYYHIQPMSADGQSNNLEKISVYENHEMSLLSHLTNEMISSYDKMLLTLFQEALVSGQLPFALSLIYQFRSLISFQTAIVISNHFGKRNIAEKVDFILQQKLALMQQGMNQEMVATAEEEENSHVNYDMSADDPIPHHQPSQLPPKSSSLLSKKAGSTKSFSSAVSNNNNNNKMNGKVVTPSSENNNNNNKITGNKRPFDEDASYLSQGEDNQPEESQQQQPEKKKGALNPFRIEKTGNTPMKKKSAMEDFSDQMKASPTPKKLNVSCFIFFCFLHLIVSYLYVFRE